MARLPIPGSDDGVWGSVLNDFLAQSHDSSGRLKPDTVDTAQIKDDAITSEQIAPNAVTKADVGLGNVDNTSDADKPVSDAVRSELDAKANSEDVGAKVILIDTTADLPAGTQPGVVVVVKN